MMNDWRDQPYNYEDENSFSVKMIAAAVVAVGFLGIGTFAYETGGSRPQTMQAVASNPFTPPPATTSGSTLPDSPSDVTSPETPSTTAEPLKNAEAGTPPVTAPAYQAAEKPVQKAEADTPRVAAPAKPQATEKLVKLSRAQRKTPVTPAVEPVQFSSPAPEPQPAQAAPVQAAPVEAAPVEAAPAVAEHTDAPPQEAPMPAAAEAPQQSAPASDSGQPGAEAAPQ